MSDETLGDLDVSVVIGFKDWGRERLQLSLGLLRDAMKGVEGEVIVADYGSEETPSVRDEVLAHGARYVYTETDGIWSRSRALNSGFAVARGRVLIATDADMIFSPSSLAKVTQTVLRMPDTALVLQCRDLPEASGVESIDPHNVDWRALDRGSRLRPRWGMGGMMAVSRESFARVRGLDERMVIYGGEDMDFAQRLQRSGTRLHWIDNPAVRMYHVWHAPSRVSASQTPEGEAAVRTNRNIYLNDPTAVRNISTWRHRLPDQPPLATVVVTTHNRAALIGDCINSVLAQSVRDFELLIIDDGSTDETEEVVRTFDDPRVRYVRQENGGVAKARNHALDLTSSPYTVIMDDDDLMLPWRLEAHFESMTAAAAGTYGGWIDFDDETGSMVANPGKAASLGSILFTGGVYAHGTLMLRTDVLRAIRYDETLRSGADYMLGVKLLRSGLNLAHTGKFHIMRRLHGHQLTGHDTAVQKTSAVLANLWARNAIESAGVSQLRQVARDLSPHPTEGASSVEERFGHFLPDSLTKRTLATISRDRSGQLCGVLTLNATWHDYVCALQEQQCVEFLPCLPSGDHDATKFVERLMCEEMATGAPGVNVVVSSDDTSREPRRTLYSLSVLPEHLMSFEEFERHLLMNPSVCYAGAWDEALVPAEARDDIQVAQ